MDKCICRQFCEPDPDCPQCYPSDKLTSEEWHGYLETRMNRFILELEDLIEKDRATGDSIQRHYLWRAKHALRDGVAWYDFFRKRKTKSGEL